MTETLDPWYLEHLRCAVSGSRLSFDAAQSLLVSVEGRSYPVIEGIPVMLPEHVAPTLSALQASRCPPPGEAPWYLSSVLLSEAEKTGIQALINAGETAVDPVAAYLVAATNGLGYAHLVGRLQEYPIPQIRLPAGGGRLLLDIGCSWGRWCIAAARRGYEPVGLDPSLGAVMAARRITRAMGLGVRFVVGDARHLPFSVDLFDQVFSYSVIQHLSVPDATQVFEHVGRVLKPGGAAMIQMPAKFGLRCLYNQLRRKFRDATGFEVRYWRLAELRKVMDRQIGRTRFTVDCFFGIGWQPGDAHLMPTHFRALIACSELLRRLSQWLPVLRHVADSVYAHATKEASR